MKNKYVIAVLLLVSSLGCFAPSAPRKPADEVPLPADNTKPQKPEEHKTKPQKPNSEDSATPTSIVVVPPTESLNVCSNLVNNAFRQLPMPTIDKAEFERKYKIEKEFAAGASGDHIYKIVDDSGAERALKVFTHASDKQKFEIMITCDNSKVPFFQDFKGMDDKNPDAFGTFFPKFFDMGMVERERDIKEPQPDGTVKIEKKKVTEPFMVIELLSGGKISAMLFQC
jgi:hypothetical protein